MKNIELVKEDGTLPLPKFKKGDEIRRKFTAGSGVLIGTIHNIITTVNQDRETKKITSVAYVYNVFTNFGQTDLKEEVIELYGV